MYFSACLGRFVPVVTEEAAHAQDCASWFAVTQPSSSWLPEIPELLDCSFCACRYFLPISVSLPSVKFSICAVGGCPMLWPFILQRSTSYRSGSISTWSPMQIRVGWSWLGKITLSSSATTLFSLSKYVRDLMNFCQKDPPSHLVKSYSTCTERAKQGEHVSLVLVRMCLSCTVILAQRSDRSLLGGPCGGSDQRLDSGRLEKNRVDVHN